MNKMRGVADERYAPGGKSPSHVDPKRECGGCALKGETSQRWPETAFDFSQEIVFGQRQKSARLVGVLGPHNRRPAPGQRQHGERTRRKEVLDSDAVVAFFMRQR